MKKLTKDEIETIQLLANGRLNDQHLKIGQPRNHFISEGDVIAVLWAVEKAAQHPLQATAEAAPVKKRGTTRRA